MSLFEFVVYLFQFCLRELDQLPSSLPPARVEMGLRAVLGVSETWLCSLCSLCPMSSAGLDFVGRRSTLELFACTGVPRNRCCTVLSSLWQPKVTSLDRGTLRLTLGAFWVVPGRAFKWLWPQTRTVLSPLWGHLWTEAPLS